MKVIKLDHKFINLFFSSIKILDFFWWFSILPILYKFKISISALLEKWHRILIRNLYLSSLSGEREKKIKFLQYFFKSFFFQVLSVSNREKSWHLFSSLWFSTTLRRFAWLSLRVHILRKLYRRYRYTYNLQDYRAAQNLAKSTQLFWHRDK